MAAYHRVHIANRRQVDAGVPAVELTQQASAFLGGLLRNFLAERFDAGYDLINEL